MSLSETELLKHVKHVPHLEKINKGSKERIHSIAEERFKMQRHAWRERKARLEPFHASMRTAAMESPALREVRTTVSGVLKKKTGPPALHHPVKLPAPRTALLRKGSVHVVDVPPFQALAWGGGEGVGDFSTLISDGNAGTMSFQINAGHDSSGNSGSGSLSCWTALGQAFSPSPDAPNILRFTASPSFNWSGNWISSWWEEAAGNLWIGQVINRFDANGVFIDTPVATQSSLESFDEYGTGVDVGFPTGSSTGLALEADLFAEPGLIYECWVWAGASVSGDESNPLWFSGAGMSMMATLSSIVIDLI